MRSEVLLLALVLTVTGARAAAQGPSSDEAIEEIVVADVTDEELEATPVFDGPHFRLGVSLNAEAISGGTLGALSALDVAIGVRTDVSLSVLLRVTADLGYWARGGSGDAVGGTSFTLDLEHLGLNALGDGRGVALELGVGGWLIDERLGRGDLGVLPYAALRVIFLVEHPESEVRPLFSPSTGLTFGIGIDPEVNVILLRIGLMIVGLELSTNGE